MLDMVKNKLKKLKGKGAARIFAAAVISSLLLSSSLGVSFALEGAGEEVYIEGGQELPEEEEFTEEETEPTEKDTTEEETAPEEEENNQTVSGQPENNQTADGQDVSDPSGNNQDVSGQLEGEMTDAVNAFLAAMDRLLELAANDAPAEEMLAAVEYARGLYENLTDEEKENPEVALRKEALDSFDSVMPLEDDGITTEAALRAAVNTDAVVTLGNDITLSSMLIINRTSDITLDLNGYTLKTTSGRVINVTNVITFTLQDSSTEKNGLITGGNFWVGGGVYCQGDFIMKNGTISGNTTGDGAYSGGGVYCAGNFTMEGGTISGNTAGYGYGGGVYCGGNFTMEGGTISGNTAGDGGGVYCMGNFTMEGGEISGNTAQGYGGGVWCYGNVTMRGGEISGNTVNPGNNAGSGGGVYCGGNFTMEGGIISGNTVSYSSDGGSKGGGVCCYSNNFTMTGGIISGNTANAANDSSCGSDIYFESSGDSFVADVLISTSPDSAWGAIDGRYINGWYYDGGFNYNDPAPGNITMADRWSVGNVQKFDKINAQWTLTASNFFALIAAHDGTSAPVTPPTPPTPDPVTPPPAHEHNYTQSKAPTCTADGEEKCSCGLTKMLPALGHSYNAGVVTKEADCETAGVKTITCSRCNDRKTEEIPPVGHTWNNGTVTTKAECEVPGVRTLTCSKCNRTKTEALPVTGHRWDNGIITQAPTQTEDGVRTYTCLNNETHKKTETVAKLGGNGGTTNPSNTDNGDKDKKQEEKKTETPEPVITHTPEPIPDAGYEYPAYRNETPDANDPATPEIIVVIGENGTPLTYRKIEDPEHPGKMIYVEDSSIPLSASPTTVNAGHWALLNLIMTLVSVLGGVYGLIGYITERRKKDKEEKRRRWYLAGAAAALLSVIVFVLTQDMRMAMVFADRYTFLMAALALMQTPGFLLRRKREELA